MGICFSPSEKNLDIKIVKEQVQKPKVIHVQDNTESNARKSSMNTIISSNASPVQDRKNVRKKKKRFIFCGKCTSKIDNMSESEVIDGKLMCSSCARKAKSKNFLNPFQELEPEFLPDGWYKQVTNGVIYYRNSITNEQTQIPPCDTKILEKPKNLKQNDEKEQEDMSEILDDEEHSQKNADEQNHNDGRDADSKRSLSREDTITSNANRVISNTNLMRYGSGADMAASQAAADLARIALDKKKNKK